VKQRYKQKEVYCCSYKPYQLCPHTRREFSSLRSLSYEWSIAYSKARFLQSAI